MNANDKIYFEGIVINEGAYFYSYHNNIGEADKKKIIKDCFKSIKEKTEDFVKIADVQRENVNYEGHKNALCSLLLFSSKAVPSFMHKLDDGYKKKECFVGYALIIEIDSYVVILSRHANGMNVFKNNLKSIDGSKLTGALLDADSLFTQLRLGSIFGSEKKNISELCIWADMVISGIKNPMDLKRTMLNNFSRPVKWQNEYMHIKPIYLLVDVHELMYKIEEQHVELVYVNGKDNVEETGNLLSKILEKHSKCLELKEITPHALYSCNNLENLLIKVTKHGIRLDSKGRLNNLFMRYQNGEKTRLTTFINLNKCFYIGFEEVSYIYYGAQLHEDSNMIENLDAILSVFEPIKAMEGVLTEKGVIRAGITHFDDDSVFGVVEDYYTNKDASFLICDDMGNECADHIAICGNTLSFIHSKACGKTSLSASQFQVVIGQAIKNIGNLRNMNITNKVNSWRNKKYGNTEISVADLVTLINLSQIIIK